MKSYFTKPLCAAVLALAPNLSVAEDCYFSLQAELYDRAQRSSRDFLKFIIGQDVRSEDLSAGTVRITRDCGKIVSGLAVYRRSLRPTLEDLRDEIYDSILTDREEGYLNCARRGSKNYDIVVQQMDNMLEIAVAAFRHHRDHCDGDPQFEWEDLS